MGNKLCGCLLSAWLAEFFFCFANKSGAFLLTLSVKFYTSDTAHDLLLNSFGSTFVSVKECVFVVQFCRREDD